MNLKYPWTAAVLAVIWFATTFIIISRPQIQVNRVLLITLLGTIAISLIGFSVPTLKK